MALRPRPAGPVDVPGRNANAAWSSAICVRLTLLPPGGLALSSARVPLSLLKLRGTTVAVRFLALLMPARLLCVCLAGRWGISALLVAALSVAGKGKALPLTLLPARASPCGERRCLSALPVRWASTLKPLFKGAPRVAALCAALLLALLNW